MKSIDDERFFDLAMKAIAHQTTQVEHAALEAMLANDPKLRVDYAELEQNVRLAKSVLPLIAATEAEVGDVPGYAQGRLQTKVKQTLGQPNQAKAAQKGRSWTLAWLSGLGVAAAAALLLILPMFRPSTGPVIEIAMLDTAGGTRGAGSGDEALFEEKWRALPLKKFTNVTELDTWEGSQKLDRGRPSAAVIYDIAAAEVRVYVHVGGKASQQTFLVGNDFGATLREADAFVQSKLKKL